MSEMVSCKACSKEIHKTSIACPQCGAPQDSGRRYKDKVVAGLLAIFLGAFGVHRFYLGKWWGIFYLLLFWTGVPGLIALVEGIVFLCTGDEKWDNKYNDGKRFGSRSSAGVVIAIVVGMLVLTAIIGILAAIAIPAYQDYVTRVKISQALETGEEAAERVQNYFAANRQMPPTLEAARFDSALPDAIRSIDWNGKNPVLRITIATGSIEGKTINLRPQTTAQGSVTWGCDSADIPQRILPQKCKD